MKFIAWALDETDWDLSLDVDGNIATVTDGACVQQNIRERLQTFLGEWFLDNTVGVPWFQEIFVRPANVALTSSILKKTILESKYVSRMLEFYMSADLRNRKVSVDKFTVLTDFGDITGSV